jgi:glycosyltransferase involved in cell wall biosynthesis
MSKLSVIIPFCNEHPQVLFTIQNIAQELRDRVDFEVIAVNNYCDEVTKQGRIEDEAGESIKSSVLGNKWLKYLTYTDKLSHWQSKNLAVKNSTGDILVFIDAHCIVARDALFKMFEYYSQHHEELNGTIHLPLTYKILESRKLIYKLQTDIDKGIVHYTFTSYRDSDIPYEVPCMSSCGSMMTRKLYDQINGWPTELGIYGGGENYLNFVLAILGKKKWIMPGGALHHHGDKRGYNWNATDFIRNRTIASYMYGDQELARKYIDNSKGDKQILDNIYNEVIIKCQSHRNIIKAQQVINIEDWLKNHI